MLNEDAYQYLVAISNALDKAYVPNVRRLFWCPCCDCVHPPIPDKACAYLRKIKEAYVRHLDVPGDKLSD